VERVEGSNVVTRLKLGRNQCYVELQALPGYKGTAGIKLVPVVKQ